MKLYLYNFYKCFNKTVNIKEIYKKLSLNSPLNYVSNSPLN